MKDIEMGEFRDRASSYITGSEPLAVWRNGRLVGYYIPVKQKRDNEELRAAVEDLRESLAEVRRATGLSEEELVAELVPKKHERGNVSA